MNYYRIKMTDVSGKVTYSGIVALLNDAKGFDIVSIYSNPVVTGNLTITITTLGAAKIDIKVIDMQGRLVKRQSVNAGAGFAPVTLDVSGLSPGTYQLSGISSEGRSSVARFVKL